MTLQVFFSKSRMTASQDDDEAESLALQLDDEVQYRCAGFVQAAIERYAEVLEEQTPSSAKGVDSDSGSSTEGEGSKMKRKKASKRKVAKGADEPDSSACKQLVGRLVAKLTSFYARSTCTSFGTSARVHFLQVDHGVHAWHFHWSHRFTPQLRSVGTLRTT
jgi:hypothetical protein